MSIHDHAVMICFESGRVVRAFDADEWSTYLALLDALTSGEKSHGVVDGKLFGHDGRVYAQEVGAAKRQKVTMTLGPHPLRRLRTLAKALSMSPGQLVAYMLDHTPLPQELNQVPERLTKSDPR